jgi:nicotinate-nucleotide pyrophosphorylase (carboxylating)
MVKVEVEVETVEQVRKAIEAGTDIIMFDNCSPEEVKDFIQEVPDEIVTEVSGGIDFETLPEYRDTGVDYVSMGMLTHSFDALDISFNVTQSSKST